MSKTYHVDEEDLNLQHIICFWVPCKPYFGYCTEGVYYRLV